MAAVYPANGLTPGYGGPQSNSVQQAIANGPQYSYEDAITATPGGGAANARQLVATNNCVTTVATAGDSVKIPKFKQGVEISVWNTSGNSMNVYPFETTTTINAMAAGSPVAVASGKLATFYYFGGTKVLAVLAVA